MKQGDPGGGDSVEGVVCSWNVKDVIEAATPVPLPFGSILAVAPAY